MSVSLEQRSDFHLLSYQKVAWGGQSVVITKLAKERMSQTRKAFEALIESEDAPSIYGVTTGYGGRAKVTLSPEARKRQAQVPMQIWAASFGETLPRRIVRGIIFARLVNYIEGHAAVRPLLAEEVASMLQKKQLPSVPIEGYGCAGEILPLSHLFSEIGDKHVLHEKESLALVNGSPCASAFVSDSALAAKKRLELAYKVFGLSAEAIRAPMEAYAPELEGLWGDQYEAKALARFRALLEGGMKTRRAYQAPVSFRIIPRLMGRAERVANNAWDTANWSLSSITDNPVFIAPDKDNPKGKVLSNGGFHNIQASMTLDSLSSAWADLCLICERHTSRLLDPDASLVEIRPKTESGEGFVDYLGMAQAGILEQARHYSTRSLLPASEAGGFDQNDVATSDLWALKKEQQLGLSLSQALAVLAAVASQVFYTESRKASPALEEFLDEVREYFPPVETIRKLGPQITNLSTHFAESVFGDEKLMKKGFPRR